MSGRLGMSGLSTGRGDRAVGLAMLEEVGKARTFVAPTRSQKIAWGTAGALGAAGAHTAHQRRDRGDRRGAAAAGAVSGASLVDAASGVGGWAARERIQHLERTRPEHKRTKTNRKILSAHKAKHGVTDGPGKNPPNAYYRGMPDGVPLARAKRIMGWKNYGPVVAGTLVAGGAAGAAISGRKVSKATPKGTLVRLSGMPSAVTPRLSRNRYGQRAERDLKRARELNRTGRRGLNPFENDPRGIEYMPGNRIRKVDTTMSDREARRLATQYDTRGPLPKGLDRETKMKAYEARYIASGGKQGERWKRRADNAETTRNIGLAGATLSAGALLATRGKKTGPKMARAKITPHRAETGALASGLLGGAAELYGEHARDRRASYSNTPAGVAGSALSRMRAYTPGGQK